jgi:hypothetical protein
MATSETKRDTLDAYAVRRTQKHTETVRGLLNRKTLWLEYGIDDDITVGVLCACNCVLTL